MKTLAEFDTLAQAKAYAPKTYRKIGGNEARQIFSINGAEDSLQDNSDSRTVVQVIEGVNTTVGALCRSVLGTLSGGVFATDPSDEDGEYNRKAAQVLEDNGVFTTLQRMSFFAKAENKKKPHANATEYDWKRAKGLPITQKEVTPINGYIKITLTKDVEAHRPQVYAVIQGVPQRVTGFGIVSKAGDYLAQVPRGYATFYVDDAYGAL